MAIEIVTVLVVSYNFRETSSAEENSEMAKTCYALVITPQPDDAEYGIAGTVAKWIQEGKEVVYVVCTNGNKGSSDPNMKPERLTQIRAQEQLAIELKRAAIKRLELLANVVRVDHSHRSLGGVP